MPDQAGDPLQRCQHLEKKKRDEAPKVPKNEAPKALRGVECGEGVSPSPLGEASREGAVPPPQKIFGFLS